MKVKDELRKTLMRLHIIDSDEQADKLYNLCVLNYGSKGILLEVLRDIDAEYIKERET